MKKLIIIFLFFASFVQAQNPVTITQPYKFLKYVQAKDSLHVYGVLFINLHDTASTMAYARLQRNGLIQIKDSGTVYLTPHQANVLMNGKVNVVDSLTKYVTHYQLSQKVDKIPGKKLSTKDYTETDSLKLAGLSNPISFEQEITTSGTTDIALPFTLKSTALVFVNNSNIRNNLWTGSGTSTITLFLDTRQKDFLKIQNQ